MSSGNKLNFLIAALFLIASASPALAFARGGSAASSLTTLIGLNESGMEEGSAIPGTNGVDYITPTLAQLQYAHSKNLNTIRLPFLWERMQLSLGSALDSTYLGYVQGVLSNAAALNMKVVIDCHNYGSYGGVKIGAAGGPTYAQFADLWTKLSAALAGSPGLGGYDLMNEPNNMPSPSTWPDAAQAAITAIRANDTATPIYVEGDGYASAFQWVGNNPTLQTLTDPNNKLIFEAHAYGDYNNSGTYPLYPDSIAVADGCTSLQTSYQCAQTMGDQLTTPTSTLDTGIFVKRYTPFVNWCRQYSLSCIIGESGVPKDDANWLTALDNGLAYLQDNKIPAFYWAAGAFLTGYNLGVQPGNNGQDTVQMAVLTQYSGAYQPNTYYLTGPNRGSSGTASGNFTVTYVGNLTKSLTITPNDNGVGGTFIPSSLTLAPGYNPSATFTYTASGSAVYTISATNNLGYVNPAALGYATQADQFSTNSVADANIVNALGLRKIYAPYIGPLVQLRRGSDNATKDFYATSTALGSWIDINAILKWNGTSETDLIGTSSIVPQYANLFGSDVSVAYEPSGTNLTRLYTGIYSGTCTPAVGQYCVSSNGSYLFNNGDIGQTVKISYLFKTYVVTWYDQSPAAHNGTIITADGSQSPSLADQPQLMAVCRNGEPCIQFSGTNRMDIASPITGNTQQTILSVFAPQYHWGSGEFLGWDWAGISAYDFFPPGSQNNIADQWQMQGGYDNRIYTQDQAWSAEAGTWTAGAANGQRVLKDGTLIGQRAASSSPLSLPYSRSNATLGYQRFGAANFIGNIGEIIVLNSALTDSQIAAFQADEDTGWNITNLSGYSWYSPTLQQNTGSGNAPPWAGENQSGAVGNFGYYACSGGLAGSGKCAFNFATPAAGQTYYVARGMNIVRLPVQWEALQPGLCTGSTTIDATSLASLDADVSTITASGEDVIIDLHNFGGYNYSALQACTSPPDDGKWTSATTSTYFVNFWTQLAAHYASNPKVYFDLMNEPAGTTATASATIEQSAITAIRGQSFDNYIFTEFGSGYAACGDVAANGGPAFLTLTDAQNKLVLECHAYLQSCGNDTCGDYAGQGNALSDLQGATTYCAANGCHLFWGEFNAGFTPSMYSELKVAFDLMAANPTVWDGWTEFGGGPAWGEGYAGLIEPRTFQTPYADRMQMRLLNTYATSHTWPSASGAWPLNVKFP